jgi:hypothetical protein
VAIKFTATIPANPNADENVRKSRVYYTVEGSEHVESHDVNGNGGQAPVKVPRGSNFEITYSYFDQDGNEGPRGGLTKFFNAQDNTPPSAPTDGVMLSKGDWVADDSPDPWFPPVTTTEEPTTEEPTTEEPTTEEPTTEEPTTEEPTTEEPVTEEPTTEAPVVTTTGEPVTEEPTTEAP